MLYHLAILWFVRVALVKVINLLKLSSVKLFIDFLSPGTLFSLLRTALVGIQSWNDKIFLCIFVPYSCSLLPASYLCFLLQLLTSDFLLLLLTPASYSCPLLLLLSPAPYSGSILLLLTPAPYSCFLIQLLTSAPFSCSLHLFITPAPYTCSSLLLLILLIIPAPCSCSLLLLFTPALYSNYSLALHLLVFRVGMTRFYPLYLPPPTPFAAINS